MADDKTKPTDKRQPASPPPPPENKPTTADNPCNHPETKMIYGNNKK